MEQSPISSFALELEAMAAVGQILCDLPDPAARQRVLKWAAERFAGERGAGPLPVALETPVRTPAPVQEVSSDPGLAIDSLDEMFITTRGGEMDDDLGEFAGPEQGAPRMPEATQRIDVMIRSFAEDFQRFVEEWNGATA